MLAVFNLQLRRRVRISAEVDRRQLRWRNGLVIAQLTISLVLLVGAGLFLCSFQQVQSVGPGLRPRAGRHPDLPDAGLPVHALRGARLHAAPALPLPRAARRRGGRHHQQPAPAPAQHQLQRLQRRRLRTADGPRRKDSDRYRCADFRRAQPLFGSSVCPAHGKVMSGSILSERWRSHWPRSASTVWSATASPSERARSASGWRSALTPRAPSGRLVAGGLKLLFDVDALDPWTFVGVPLALGAAALLAAYLPARRASRVHPVTALRTA